MNYLKNANFIKYFKMSQVCALAAAITTLIVDRTVFHDLSGLQKIALFLTFEYFGLALAKNIYRIKNEIENIELKDKVRMELYFAQVVSCVFLSMGLYMLVVKGQPTESMFLFWPVIASIFFANTIVRFENTGKNAVPKVVLSKEEKLKRKMTVETITGRYNTGILILLGLPTLWFIYTSIGGPTWVPFMVLIGFYTVIAAIFFGATYFVERTMINNGVVQLADEPVVLEASVTYTAVDNYSEGYLALTKVELIFVSFPNYGKAEIVKIPLNEIESIDKSMTFGILPTAFTVLDKNGLRHKFHCAKRNLWIEKTNELCKLECKSF